MAPNSSRSQKMEVMASTFPVKTFLSSAKNGSNSTESDAFVMLNVGGLDNSD